MKRHVILGLAVLLVCPVLAEAQLIGKGLVNVQVGGGFGNGFGGRKAFGPGAYAYGFPSYQVQALSPPPVVTYTLPAYANYAPGYQSNLGPSFSPSGFSGGYSYSSYANGGSFYQSPFTQGYGCQGGGFGAQSYGAPPWQPQFAPQGYGSPFAYGGGFGYGAGY
jgi:hypothetical protein